MFLTNDGMLVVLVVLGATVLTMAGYTLARVLGWDHRTRSAR